MRCWTILCVKRGKCDVLPLIRFLLFSPIFLSLRAESSQIGSTLLLTLVKRTFVQTESPLSRVLLPCLRARFRLGRPPGEEDHKRYPDRKRHLHKLCVCPVLLRSHFISFPIESYLFVYSCVCAFVCEHVSIWLCC